jgi:hypothetical protein
MNNLASAASGQVAAAGVGSGPFSSITISNTTVMGNTASAPNGLARGGGLGLRESTANVTASSFVRNIVTAPGGTALGGGIYGEGAQLTLSRSTVTANTVTATTARGGGIGNQTIGSTPGKMTITATSIASNSATGTSATGGGVYNADPPGSSVTLNQSSVAGNSPNNCTPAIGSCA